MFGRSDFARHTLLIVVATVLVGLSALMIAASMEWVDSRARLETDALALKNAEKHASLLASELQKFRLLPLALSEYPDVRAVLEGGGPETVASLNAKLELLADRTNASAIYVIGRDGLTLASSNWREPGSFIGSNFSFRPYFRDGMTAGEAELFAVGSVTGKQGLFIARRIDRGERALGVIVVKIDFTNLENEWTREGGQAMVIDSHGVVIVTSKDSWRFRSTRALSAQERAELRGTMQFGSAALEPIENQRLKNGDVLLSDNGGHNRAAEIPTAIRGARLIYFEPLEPARARAAANARLVVLVGLAIAGVIFAIVWRTHMGRLAQADSRRLLEAQVSLRTSELQAANSRMKTESQRRIAAESRWRAAREELAQAHRLSLIGQITTGIAHEVNQPVAAIRAFAENARRHLERKDDGQVEAKLGDIIDLTDRIGRITTELRNFARRGTPVICETPLSAAIDGAILLIADRIRAEGVTLEWAGLQAEVGVIADKVRLEQILINLIQNALDALRDTPDPHIAILVKESHTIQVTVADNGPGVHPSMATRLFTPFATSKPDGLGLGLGMVREIAREFGGSLDLVASPLEGAAFRITLRRAK